MKRFLLLVILTTLCMPFVHAQDVRKVAILETVDKEGKVSYAHRLMLRASLAKAITEAQGYEAYDRVDLASVMSEQNFQRTGMVSDEEIRKLGQMTGAHYVLIAEAVMVDEGTMFITAKIIDVETAQTIKTESQLMKANPTDIQIGCTTMAGNMLGIKLDAGITKSQTSSTSSTPTPVAATALAQKPNPVENVKISYAGAANISFRFKRCYMQGNKCFVHIGITNNTGSDIEFQLCNSRMKTYDDNGGIYEDNNYDKDYQYSGTTLAGKIMGNQNSSYIRTEIPNDITVELKVVIKNFDETASMIKVMQFTTHNSKDSGYQKLELRNIPISK